VPDRFIEHGERAELFADLGLDVQGICSAVRKQSTRQKRNGQRFDRREYDVRTTDY
jgi:hypothetical protein